MSKELDRIEIVEKIQNAAKLYKEKLVGRKFMYVFDGRYIEVIFKADNFKHLMGVDTHLSAMRFYKYAVSGKLASSQIWFSSLHPYQLSLRKVKHIEEIATLARSEGFILEEVKTETMTYKFGTTDLNFTLCLNKDTRDDIEVNECYSIHSLRDEDCFSKSDNIYDILYIFSSKNDEDEYTELLYIDDSTCIDDLPEEAMVKMSDKLVNEIAEKSKKKL